MWDRILLKFGVDGRSDQVFNAFVEGGFKFIIRGFESPLQKFELSANEGFESITQRFESFSLIVILENPNLRVL